MEEAGEPIPLAALARAVGLSPSHFHRRFKDALGITPKAYASALRSNRVREALARGLSVTEALYHAGYNSSGRFYADATSTLGMTPRSFRSGGAAEELIFAIAPWARSPAGPRIAARRLYNAPGPGTRRPGRSAQKTDLAPGPRR
ncbi:MAG: helix-turn-helix domain-containing protein, partial [Pseudomonadota bacterium]